MDNNYYKHHKNNTIRGWKRYEVISDDFNKLYKNHMNINNCQLCKVEFNQNIKCLRRTLDHDHATGLYRQTICHKCNRGFDNKIRKDNKLNHKNIYLFKRKVNNKYSVSFQYQKIVNDKRIVKTSTSLTKLIAFSFIQELKFIQKCLSLIS